MLLVIRIAGDHEENVDPHEAARHHPREGMEDHHRTDGEGAQAVDVASVAARQRGFTHSHVA